MTVIVLGEDGAPATTLTAYAAVEDIDYRGGCGAAEAPMMVPIVASWVAYLLAMMMLRRRRRGAHINRSGSKAR